MSPLLLALVGGAAAFLGVRFIVGFVGWDAERAGQRARQTVEREVTI